MAISSLGAGSGLDLSGILTNLMSLEQQPLLNLQNKEVSYTARLSALGSLKGALASLQTAAGNLLPASGKTAAEKYASYSASVADSAIASATASSASVPGVYSLEVSKLAQNQRLATGTSGAPATSPYATAAATIGQGTLTINLGSLSADGLTYTADSARKLDITIDATNNTLGGLRDAINAANSEVSATIVTGTAGAQLVLTAKNSGMSNVMQLSGLGGFEFDPTAPTAGGFSQDAAQGGRAAQNAEFSINGIAATSSTNTVSNVLDGVTLTLAKTTAVGESTTVTVSKNSTGTANTALTAFIKSFNEANTMVSQLGAYNAETKQAGALQGQAIVRSSQAQMRNLVFNTTAGGSSKYQRLSDIGITIDKTGALALDSTKLNAALSADYSGVVGLIEKVGSSFKTGMESLVGTSGTINGMTDNVKSMIKSLDAQQSTLSARLVRTEERYRKQFTSLDTLIAGMKETSTYLTQQLANLPGARN